MKESEQPKPKSQPGANAVTAKDTAHSESTETQRTRFWGWRNLIESRTRGDSCHCKPDQTPGWKITLEVIAVLAVLAYTRAAFQQLEAMNGQITQMQHAAEISHGQLDILRMQQRAWVRAEINLPPKFTLKDLHDRVGIPFYAENAGNTPAMGLVGTSYVEILDKGKPPSLDYASRHRGTWFPQVMFPKEKASDFAIQADPSGVARRMTTAEREGLADGTKYLVWYCKLKYEDAFGWHWTHYCGWRSFGPPGTAVAALSCVAYNEVGEGNPSN
jgi:hypothetical protein